MKNYKYILVIIAAFLVSGFSGRISKNTNGQFVFNSAGAYDNCPVINEENITLTYTDCNKTDGSITGLTVQSAGTKITYTWRDANNNVVGNKLDLLNIPAGTYTLQVSDNSGCKQKVYSSPEFIGEKGITIDLSKLQITKAGCNNDGAITGLIVKGATIFQWHNFLTGTDTITPGSALKGVAAAAYRLTASNNNGCISQSPLITVSSTFDVPTVGGVKTINPKCFSSNDSIEVTLVVRKGSPELRYYFVNTVGDRVGDGYIFGNNIAPKIQLGGIRSGKYGLYVYSESTRTCPVLIGTFTLVDEQATIVIDSTTVHDDKCNAHIGAISPTILGLSDPRGTLYTWIDTNTKVVVATTKYLLRIGAGIYKLKVVDPAGCTVFAVFTVKNDSPPLITPQADGTTICLPGMINISVKNLVTDTAGTYRLYANETDSIPLASSPGGVFYRQIKKTTDFYVAYKQNDCESARTKVTEVVVANVNIPNAFTPNNDGINDYWNIQGIVDFPGASVDVFNRSGQLVFHSINYSKPFDGRYNGVELPVGVYYYIIDLKQRICFGKISGSLTIIR